MEGSVYLEDLHVGQRFESASHVVTTDEIKAFARQFDPQPFHLDEAAAARSMFGGLAASGWHTAALTMRLLVGGRRSDRRRRRRRGRGDHVAAPRAAG